MDSIKNLVGNEPVLITGLVEAILALVVAFGADLSAEQVGAIMAVVAVATAIVARAFVSPVIPEE